MASRFLYALNTYVLSPDWLTEHVPSVLIVGSEGKNCDC